MCYLEFYVSPRNRKCSHREFHRLRGPLPRSSTPGNPPLLQYHTSGTHLDTGRFSGVSLGVGKGVLSRHFILRQECSVVWVTRNQNLKSGVSSLCSQTSNIRGRRHQQCRRLTGSVHCLLRPKRRVDEAGPESATDVVGTGDPSRERHSFSGL